MRPAKLGKNFLVSVQRAGAGRGTPAAEAPHLPMHCDALVTVPPTATSYVRRVRRLNLWLDFREKADTSVVFIVVVRHPPIPVDDDEGDGDGDDPDFA